jgi:RNA polymerase sigma factor for flagellar operon FliA
LTPSVFLRKQNPLDHRVQKKIDEIHKAIETLTQSLDREPSDSELAMELGISLEQVKNIIAKKIFLVSIESQIFPSDQDNYALDLPSPDSLPVNNVVKRDLAKAIEECSQKLTNKNERYAFLLRYLQDFSIPEISEFLSIPITKIYILLVKAKNNIRTCLELKEWDVTD